jgi:hypothetical protein
LLAFSGRDPADAGVAEELVRLDARLPAAATDSPYLEVTLTEVPEIARPKVKPKRLSTGQAPIEIARVEEAWLIRCTGCGEASRLVQFRWQALEETIDCRCD